MTSTMNRLAGSHPMMSRRGGPYDGPAGSDQPQAAANAWRRDRRRPNGLALGARDGVVPVPPRGRWALAPIRATAVTDLFAGAPSVDEAISRRGDHAMLYEFAGTDTPLLDLSAPATDSPPVAASFDIDGVEHPASKCRWLVIAPCGCTDGLLAATNEHGYPRDEHAAARIFFRTQAARRAEEELGFLLRLAAPNDPAITTATSHCPHDPQWGRPPTKPHSSARRT